MKTFHDLLDQINERPEVLMAGHDVSQALAKLNDLLVTDAQKLAFMDFEETGLAELTTMLEAMHQMLSQNIKPVA